MADSQNSSKLMKDKGANFASNESGREDSCERLDKLDDTKLNDLLKPSPLNALKHSAQSMMISHYTKAFKGQNPKAQRRIETALKEEPLTIASRASEPLTPKKVEESALSMEHKEVESEQNNSFEFDPFVKHTKDELMHAIEQARLNAMKKHDLINDSEYQYISKDRVLERKEDLFAHAKAIADLALKDGVDKGSAIKTQDKDKLNKLDSDKLAQNIAKGFVITNENNAVSSTMAMSLNASGKKAPFAYIKTSVETKIAHDHIFIEQSSSSNGDNFSAISTNGNDKSSELDNNENLVVGARHSAYDDAFGGDNKHLPSEHHDERLDPGKINTPVDPLAVLYGAKKSELEDDVNESSVRHEDPLYWAQGGIEAHEESTLPSYVFSSDGPEDSVLLHNKLSQIKCLGVPTLSIVHKENLSIPFKQHEHVDVNNIGISAQERLGVQGLVNHSKVHDNSMSHYRGGYMPCYFIYDNGSDRFLLDEGSCRLIGVTYSGAWIPSSYIHNQLSFIDEEQIFSVFFNPQEGNKIFSHVKIKQGPHSGERLYISGSVIQRDDTGIAMLVSGYFTQAKSKYMECLCKFMNQSSSFDVDTFTSEVQFGSAYHLMLGLSDNDRMPRTVKDFEENFVHPEDLMVYRKQNDVIYNPSLGDYYESIYRIKHRGGYYIWCIDRGLVIERKSSGMASRIIGTTTNIDVVRSNFERLKRSIYQDPLTGLHNRFYLNTRYKYFTMEESQPLSLVYVDISGLKVINDYLGHAKGDDLVKLSAQILCNDVYLDHEVVRLSGDEFLLIFTNCSYDQCKDFIDKFAHTLDERNHNNEFPLPIYFGFGIATLNEIEDGDTFLRCEARADVRLQEYKSAHRTRIYTHLQAFIEHALGQKVVFSDNRRLEYLDKEDNEEPDVVPSNQLSKASLKERSLGLGKNTNISLDSSSIVNSDIKELGIIPSFMASAKVPHYQGSFYGVKFNSVHPSLITNAAKIEQDLAVAREKRDQELTYDNELPKIQEANDLSKGSYNHSAFDKKSALAALSRMQYLKADASASAEVFMAAGLQQIELDFAEQLSVAQRQIDARNAAQEKLNLLDEDRQNNIDQDKVNNNESSWSLNTDDNKAKSHNSTELLDSDNTLNKISPNQERMLMLAAEQAAMDDMIYAKNSITMPDDLSAGFGSLQVRVGDLNNEQEILNEAHKMAKEARSKESEVIIKNGPNGEVGDNISPSDAQSALYEAQTFLNKLHDVKGK